MLFPPQHATVELLTDRNSWCPNVKCCKIRSIAESSPEVHQGMTLKGRAAKFEEVPEITRELLFLELEDSNSEVYNESTCALLG